MLLSGDRLEVHINREVLTGFDQYCEYEVFSSIGCYVTFFHVV